MISTIQSASNSCIIVIKEIYLQNHYEYEENKIVILTLLKKKLM